MKKVLNYVQKATYTPRRAQTLHEYVGNVLGGMHFPVKVVLI